ncbi:MAG: acetyl-CoA sensor PanZ family protein [Venatoribacter sp.]
MPVLLEQINKPAEADWIDLEKIHQDTASNGFLLNRQQLQTWFDQGGWVMAGRFNDRLIGALLAKQTEQGIELSQAGVRTITQRRGVMHQLMHFITHWAKENQKTLYIAECPKHLEAALLKRGFELSGSTLLYQ